MVVLLTSFADAGGMNLVISQFFSGCPHFVAEKSLILWLIDDQGYFNEDYVKSRIGLAQKISKGLKHPFIFQYTSQSKIESLLTFLLNVATKAD